MASIRLRFRKAAHPSHEGTLYYQIIHERKVRQLTTGYHILPEEWSDRRAAIQFTAGSVRRNFLLSLRQHVRWDIERLCKIADRLDDEGFPYTPDDIIAEFRRLSKESSLFNYMESQITHLRQLGKMRTAETYTTTLNSFRKFRHDEDIMLGNITSGLMESFEAWHRSNGNTPNTISFYARVLRAVYNRAVEEGIIENREPFRRVYTGIDKTARRAIPFETIKQIKRLNLSRSKELDFARDMFMMSFYLRGISFIDLAFLKKSDLSDGILHYRRHKTGQMLSIRWTGEMQAILDKYPENPTVYLMPILRRKDVDQRNAYRNMNYNINRSLKKIGVMTGLGIPLTMYVARHSWATVAKSKGIPVSVISEGLGHDRESTTLIYLASLQTSEVDRANDIIIKGL